MSKRKRQPISRKLRKSIEEFYGQNTCVVRDDASKTHLHHIDEDPSNSFFENLIPIDAGLNQAIESRDDIEELDPRFLSVRARHHLRGSLYSRAYGCSRLGLALCASRGYADEATRLAATAVRSLRPIGRVDLVSDILDRAVIPTLGKERTVRCVTYAACAELLDELALVHLEFGSPSRCRRCFSIARQYLSADPVQSEAWTRVLAQVLRHDSFSRLEHGDVESAVTRMRVADEFIAMNESAPEIDSRSQALWEGRVALRTDALDALAETIQNLERARGNAIFAEYHSSPIRKDNLYRNVWMEAALLIIKAEVEYRQGKTDDAFDKVREIGRLFEAGIHPTTGSQLPVIEAFATRANDPTFLVPLVSAADLLRFEVRCGLVLDLLEAHSRSLRMPHRGSLISIL